MGEDYKAATRDGHDLKLVYLHGFGSSAASGTVKTLKELLPEFDVVAPDIPVDPAEALPFLRRLCMNEVPDVIVGTSMGGMYTQQMRGYKRICVNPAFEMSKKSKVLRIGTHEYFKPRKDGATHFEITAEIDGLSDTYAFEVSGVNNVAAGGDEIDIYCYDGNIVAKSALHIEVYSMSGVMVANADGELIEAGIVGKGIYIVVATDAAGNRQAEKVIVK